MANFGPSDITAQVTTGNVRTTMDIYDTTKPANGAQNPLGTLYYAVEAVSAANPNGVPTVYRYVRYNSTANPAVQANPVAVWWADATFTTVTGKLSEAWGAMGASAFAGIIMPNSTDISGLTAAKLNGNFVWIAVHGYVKAVLSAASAAGDKLMAAAADFNTTGGLTNVAVGVAATSRIAAYAAAASPSDVWVVAE